MAYESMTIADMLGEAIKARAAGLPKLARNWEREARETRRLLRKYFGR